MRIQQLMAFLSVVVLPFFVFALVPGDPAPALKAHTWFNGDAVNPAEPDGKTVYVVEFWATWCPPCRKSIPHLNQLHDLYSDKNVVIVGVTKELEKVVKPFMEKMSMKYRVALAAAEDIDNTWMKTVEGIPHAFIVDTNGIVVWQGHPMDRLDEALADVVSGTFDPQKYASKDEEDISEELGRLQELLMGGQFEDALGFIEERLKEQPALRLYQMKLSLLVELDRPEEVTATYREMARYAWDDAERLNEVAWMAATAPFPLSDLESALKAANRAVELSERKDAAILDTLARVYYAIGRLPDAVRIQEEAVSRASDSNEKKDLQKTLNHYRTAQSISESLDKQE